MPVPSRNAATSASRRQATLSRDKMEEQVMSQVKQTFAPEFINRLDEIIIFDELTDDDLAQIVDLQIAKLNEIVENRDLQDPAHRRSPQMADRKNLHRPQATVPAR